MEFVSYLQIPQVDFFSEFLDSSFPDFDKTYNVCTKIIVNDPVNGRDK